MHQKFPVGTKFVRYNKKDRVETVVDYLVTTNLKNEIVKSCYVTAYEYLGQSVYDYEVPQSTISRSRIV